MVIIKLPQKELMMNLKENGEEILTKIDGIGKTKARIIYEYLI